jgi:glucan-binding YG repeat protein
VDKHVIIYLIFEKLGGKEMFKRSTKITSLLVAAASVASMVPAMATEKVDELDGTIYNAIAYKDGKAYIDGDDIEGLSEGAYYLSDGKYTELDDVDSGDEAESYSDKYVEVEGGDYYLDLETGKVTDDEIKDDATDDAATALRKKIRKDNDDRYTSDMEKDDQDVAAIPGNKFADVWYETQLDSESGDNHGAAKYTVYTDAEGNYIDADYNAGKINVVSTTDGSINLKNTTDDDEGYTVSVESNKTIASDANYIYRFANISIYDADDNNVTDSVKFGSKHNSVEVPTTDGSVTVLQKISKAQDSDDIDGAKYAKTVDTYFLTDEDGDSVDLLGEDTTADEAGYTVVDGKFVTYRLDDGNLKATSYDLKSKNGFYYLDEDDSDDIDLEVSEDGEYAWDIDAEGNIWGLDSGYLKKFNNSDSFDKIYKVDGGMDELSVYDENNIVVWNEDDEVYSVIGAAAEDTTEDTTTEDTTTEDTTPVITTGWAQDATTGTWNYVQADGTKVVGWLQSPASGKWYFMDATGTMMANGWVNDGGTWYYLTSTGAMATGWVKDGSTWYYLAGSGAMQTGWINDNGTWYYCNASGAMLSNTTVDGYVLGASGAWIK